jgi:predicted ATP-grasp superfamily ATP-dependent carboligase
VETLGIGEMMRASAQTRYSVGQPDPGAVLARRPGAMRCDALVLDASLRQSLVTVRSLGRRGLAIAAAETHPEAPAFASRWCREGFVVPAQEGTEAYDALLEQWLDRTGARVVIAVNDATIALLRRHRARLEQRLRLALAPEQALATAISKERTLEVARRLEIPVPREVVVRDGRDVAVALKEIGLPAVIKPSESWLWNGREGARLGPQLAVTAAELRDAVEAVTRFGEVALIQQLLTGRREAVSFLYAAGEVYARFAQWAKRTSPPLGGNSVLRQSIPIPADIGSYAESLVRHIDLEGYCEVEFRRDGAGMPYLMEINPRLSASVEIAVRAGVDFPYLLYQWASGGPIDRVATYRIGGWMRHLGGDIATTMAALRQRGRPGIAPPVRTLWDFGLSFLKPMAYDYVQWTDPLPAVRATTNFTRGAIRSLLSRVWQQRLPAVNARTNVARDFIRSLASRVRKN